MYRYKQYLHIIKTLLFFSYFLAKKTQNELKSSSELQNNQMVNSINGLANKVLLQPKLNIEIEVSIFILQQFVYRIESIVS